MEISLSESIEQRILKARIRLSLKQPFLAASVMRLPLKDASDMPWCETMSTDGYHIFFNAPWVSQLQDEEIQGVVAHEVLHVVFGHADRKGNRDHHKWNIACDLAINLLLVSEGQALPTSGLLDMRFRGMSADQIYAELPEVERTDLDSFESRQSQIQNSGPARRVRSGRSLESEIGADLLDPEDIRVRPLQDDDAPDRQSRREMRRQLVNEMSSSLHGNSSALIRQEIEMARSSAINWRALLRSWLSERVKSDWSTYPFSKKHIWRGIYLPSVGVQAPGHIVFAIDTSGSMSQEDIADIAAEVRSLRDTFHSKLTVIQSDAKIQSIEEYEADDPTPIPKKTTAVGRGGTDFRPVFEFVKNNYSPTQLVIYATDGFGSFPDRTPEVPCLWMLTPRSVPKERLPFGYAIKTGS
jgi:predicted metal-dependent peptidase